ncbi:hypothetical protein [Actinomadura montaniterrae]|uniref:Uncharacterized protein n=1 Tax=Actinomadura montaniterrae TaxID=1803903 RepID=A0A6L3VUP1_9ACTN|nr:hypothetical protein [Actinomadura montaniterrae]KAB2380133.1 hypothetical protein F9B16_18315 [Actinomadura montaniterrae]
MDLPRFSEFSEPERLPKPKAAEIPAPRGADNVAEQEVEERSLADAVRAEELARVARDAQDACDDVVAEFGEPVSRAEAEGEDQDAAELRDLKAAFSREVAAWEVPGSPEGGPSSSFEERAEQCARRDADLQMARREERAESLRLFKKEASDALDAQEQSQLEALSRRDEPERLREDEAEVKEAFDRGRAKLAGDGCEGSGVETVADPFSELNDCYQKAADEERRSREAPEKATRERKDAVLESFGRSADDAEADRRPPSDLAPELAPDPASEPAPDGEGAPGFVERAKSAIMFRAITYAMDGIAPGAGATARYLKTIWETGEALTGDGPVRITIPIGDDLGVTLADSGRGLRLRFDVAFGDLPSIGPEGTPTTGKSRADATVPDVGAIAISVKTGEWRNATEPPRRAKPAVPEVERPGGTARWYGPGEAPTPGAPAAEPANTVETRPETFGEFREPWSERPHLPIPGRPDQGPPEPGAAAESAFVSEVRPDAVVGLDLAEFLVVVVYADIRNLHGHDLAVYGLNLARQALHRRLFDTRRPKSMRTSAQWLRRIGVVILYDRVLGLAVYIDVDLRTHEPSCKNIGVLTTDVVPPLA